MIEEKFLRWEMSFDILTNKLIGIGEWHNSTENKILIGIVIMLVPFWVATVLTFYSQRHGVTNGNY